MAKGKVRLKVGFRPRQRSFQKLASDVETNLGHAAQTWAVSVVRDARMLVPHPPGIAPRTPWAKNSPSGYVRTGNLQRSIAYKRTASKKWKVSVGEDYGIYVEYGTRKMIAQPYFRPAIVKANKTFRKKLDGVLRYGR